MAVIRPKNTIKGTYGVLRFAGVPGNTDFVGALPGAQLIDTTNKKLYINTGTAAVPTWTVTGSQS